MRNIQCFTLLVHRHKATACKWFLCFACFPCCGVCVADFNVFIRGHAQEEEVLTIFTEDAPKPVNARLDIANTWFVQFTDEEDTKRAFDYVQGKEFKVRPA